MESTAEKPQLKTIEITDEMGQSYMDYAMSVIVSRALPDVRDGLKPVHRRILYAMQVGDYHASKSHKKSARIVGDVMGKYHPHGDAAIYETMVRMAQPWAMRNVLVDGQGNFGSLDGDAAAAMRYTEARMSRLSHEITADLDKGTVDWRPTYDESDTEPTVLPARFPNFLVNGGTGIAVGMATNMPTHNLGETIDACLAYMENPEISVAELMRIMPGPDFPTKGTIMGRGGIREAYATGRGSIAVSGFADIEEGKSGKTRIIVTELPYAVNKVKFMEKIVELVNDKSIEGITDVRDESDREEGVRVVIDLRRDVDPNLTLNKLRKHTQLVTSFGYNATCLDSRGRPRVMGLQQILGEFIGFRRQVIRRRTIHDLDNARDNLHKQVGLYAAISLVDEVVRTIRSASDPDDARVKLMAMDFPTEGSFAELIREADPDAEVGKLFRLSDIQTTSILSLSLRSLTGLERDKIAEKARELSAEIKRYVEILNNIAVLNGILRQELEEVKAKFSTERLTRIEDGEFGDISDEDLIERKDVVLTFTNTGYAKRTDLAAYREQKRGGKGRNGMETKDEDFVTDTLVCTTKTPLIFFTSRGIAHGLKAYRLPETAPGAKGRPIINFLTLRQDETISTILPMPEDPAELEGKSLVFVTDFGTVRRNAASEFADLRKNGKIAIKLEDENGNPMGRLVSVMLADDKDDVIIATRSGICTRFSITDVRVFKGRDSVGVRAINLAEDNTVINASILRHSDATPAERQAFLAGGRTKIVTEAGEQDFALTDEQKAAMASGEQRLLTVSALGYGKRSSSYEYRITNRGGKGIAAANINPTTGPLIACFQVDHEDGLVLVTDGGQTIRTRVSDIREVSRGSRGVRLFRLPEGQQIVSVARVSVDEVEGQETALEQDDAATAAEDAVVQD